MIPSSAEPLMTPQPWLAPGVLVDKTEWGTQLSCAWTPNPQKL